MMKKMTIMVAALLLVLSACGGAKTDTSGKVELSVSVWNYEAIPEFKALFTAYEAKNPNVKINPIDIAITEYEQKLTVMLAGGDTTDVLTMKNIQSYIGYAEKQQLEDVSDMVTAEKNESMVEAVSALEMADGKYYASPYRSDFWVLYYNKKLFDDAGIAYPESLTWEQYTEAAKKLSKNDQQNFGTYTHVWRSLVQGMYSAETDNSLVTGSYDFLAPHYKTMLELQDAGAMMPFGTAKSTKTTYASQFETEKAAMMPMGTWYMATLTKAVSEGKTNVDWGIAPLPQVKSNGSVTSMGLPTSFAVNKNSKNKEEAKKFLEFASGEEGAKVLAGIGVTPAYRTDEIVKSYFGVEGMPTDAISKKAFAPDKVNPEMQTAPKTANIDKILAEEHDLIMLGEVTIDQGIQNMNRRVKEELA